MAIRVRTCKVFDKTQAEYAKQQTVKKKLVDFIQVKTQDPRAVFGGKDRPFIKTGNLSGFWHAGLTGDVSIVYKIETVDGEKVLDLYGIFSHDELGTGQPANIKRQHSNADRLNNQVFK